MPQAGLGQTELIAGVSPRPDTTTGEMEGLRGPRKGSGSMRGPCHVRPLSRGRAARPSESAFSWCPGLKMVTRPNFNFPSTLSEMPLTLPPSVDPGFVSFLQGREGLVVEKALGEIRGLVVEWTGQRGGRERKTWEGLRSAFRRFLEWLCSFVRLGSGTAPAPRGS